MNKVRHSSGLALTVAAVVLALPASANAASAGMTGSAALKSGQGRAIAAAWYGDGTHFKVNFNCDTPGCANFTSSNTTTTGLSRYVQVYTCTGYVANHSLAITDLSNGSSAYAGSQTSWARGNIC